MPMHGKIPEAVWAKAESMGFPPSRVEHTVKLDRGRDGSLCDCYIFALEGKLLFLTGINIIREKKGKRRPGSPKIEAAYRSLGAETVDISHLSEFSVEQLISGMIITAKRENGETVTVTKLSASVSREARAFCDALCGKETSELDEGESEPCCPKCNRPYPDPHRKVCPHCVDRAGVLRRFWFFTKKYKWSVFVILFAMILASALTVVTPYISSGFMYDSVLTVGGKYYGQILLVVFLLVATKVLSLLVNMVNEVASAIVVPKIIYDLKKVIFCSIERLSIGFFTNRQTGSLMNQVNGDANTIYWFYVEGLPRIIILSVQTLAVAVIMFVLNWQLALLSVAFAPVVLLLSVQLFKYMNKLHSKRYSKARSVNGLLTDVLGGVRVVKAFAREKEEINRFDAQSRALAKADNDVGISNTTLFRLVTFLFTVSSSAVLGIGGWSVVQGHMTYGELITFTAYASMLYSPLMSFVDMTNWVANSFNAMQRLIEVMDAEPEVKEAEDAVHSDALRGDIEFRDVEFSYEKNRRKIIDGISFSIKAGETVGIVGHTGAGKSTVANLLIRLYDADRGEIIIDGRSVREYTFETLRRNIAIVSQETYLFQGTIYDNIAYGKPDASRDEVVRAARISGAHDFICKLPDGYATKIGFGHKDLSGGEKQRVSIARAILRDPPILILDEATSAMDTRTERSIQEALTRLSAGRTTIMIAHRLSTLRDADFLMCLENGKIPETGTHGELIRKKGIYYKLYKLQQEALKDAGIEND